MGGGGGAEDKTMGGGEDKRLMRINLFALHHFSSGKLFENKLAFLRHIH